MTDLYTVEDLPIKEQVEIQEKNRKVSKKQNVIERLTKVNRKVSWADIVKKAMTT